MMADSSDEENVPPVQKFVQEVSSDKEESIAKPAIPDHMNDNTYDYNDSFIDDNVGDSGGGEDSSSDPSYEFSEKDAASSSDDDPPEVVTLDETPEKPKRKVKRKPPRSPQIPPTPSTKTMTFLESLSLAKNEDNEIDFSR